MGRGGYESSETLTSLFNCLVNSRANVTAVKYRQQWAANKRMLYDIWLYPLFHYFVHTGLSTGWHYVRILCTSTGKYVSKNPIFCNVTQSKGKSGCLWSATLTACRRNIYLPYTSQWELFNSPVKLWSDNSHCPESLSPHHQQSLLQVYRLSGRSFVTKIALTSLLSSSSLSVLSLVSSLLQYFLFSSSILEIKYRVTAEKSCSLLFLGWYHDLSLSFCLTRCDK